MKLVLHLLLIFLVLASGCTLKPHHPQALSSSSQTSTTPTFQAVPYPDLVHGCLFTICNANETSRDYKSVYNELGLRQINFDPHRELGVGVDGDLVAWQIDRFSNHTNSDIYAYNITLDRLYALGWEPYYDETLFEVSQGRIVFSRGLSAYAPNAPPPDRLVLWTESTGEWRGLRTGLEGGPYPYGFDGSWVVFENRGLTESTPNGYFALNVDTGNLVPLYVYNDHPEFASQVSIVGPAVTSGFGYYELHTLTGSRHFWLHEVNLATREDRIVHEGDVYEGFASMRASTRYVVWYASFYNDWVLYVYDRVTGEGGPLTDRWTESLAPTFDVGGNWAVYRSSPPGGAAGAHPIVGMYIPSKTRVILVPDDPKLFPEIPATDGNRFVGTLTRNDYRFYDQNGSDLYWKMLPDIQETPG